MQNNKNRKNNRYCNTVSSPKKLGFSLLANNENQTQTLFGGCDMKRQATIFLSGIAFLMLSLGAIAGGGGSSKDGQFDWVNTPAEGTAIRSGQQVTARLGFYINNAEGSIRLRGGCYLNSNPDNQTNQNFKTSTGGTYERSVTMQAGNGGSISNSGYDDGVAYKSTEVCRVELWTNDKNGGVRFFPVQQAIAWTQAPSEQIVGGPAAAVQAKATTADDNHSNRIDTGTAVTLSSLTTSICTISGGMVTPVSHGNCQIRASAANKKSNGRGYNDKDDLAATTDTRTWPIKRTQTITITTPPPASATINATFPVAATASSGESVVIAASGACSILSSGTGNANIKINTSGACSITFNQPGTVTWAVAPQISRTVTVQKSSQSITFSAQAAQVYAPNKVVKLAPLAVASSDLAVAHSVTTPTVCSIYGAANNQILIKQAGTCTVNADQSGNSFYNPAATVSQSIVIGQSAQEITVTQTAPNSVERGASFSVAATASSGLPVTISWSGSACASGSSVTSANITTQGEGICNVSYQREGNVNYTAAASISSAVTVTRLLQEIIITQPASARRYLSDGPFVVKAETRTTAGTSSGLNVSISTSGGCSGAGVGQATITLNNAIDLCIIHYNQSGNANYLAAPQRTNEVEAIRFNQTITVTTPAPDRASKNQVFNVAATADSGQSVLISVSGGCSLSGGNGSASITMLSDNSACTVHYKQSGNNEYYPAQEVINLVRDGTAPIIAETKAIAAQTNATPSYGFTSSEAGTIIFGGACKSKTMSVAAGENTIVFDALEEGTYANCTLRVKDLAENLSNILNLTSFNVVTGVKAYVKPISSGAGDCSSWANACSDIQQAINIEAADEVWLAKGVYRPSNPLVVKSGLKMLGGFVGNEVSAGKANPAKNLSIISADVDSNDVVDSNQLVQDVADIQGTNLTQLIRAHDQGIREADLKVYLAGIVLNAAKGHAISVRDTKLELERIHFLSNNGSQGTAIMLENGSKVDVKASIFTGNEASNIGGAIASDNNVENSLTVQASSFVSNKAVNAGGAIAHRGGKLAVVNSTFVANQATASNATGGAIDLGNLVSPSSAGINYTTLMGNAAGSSSGKGGAIYIGSGAAVGVLRLANTLILNNSANTAGNIADMNKVIDAGFNIVGFNNVSGAVAGASNYQFTGTSITSSDVELDSIIEPTVKNNGGFTPTLALTLNSVARDRIPAAHLDCGTTGTVKKDQRGLNRPDAASGNCDIGAFESEGLDYCQRVAGQDSGIHVNQNGENGQLCGNGWQFGSGASSGLMLWLISLLAMTRIIVKRRQKHCLA